MTHFLLSGELRTSYLFKIAGAITPIAIIAGWLVYAVIREKIQRKQARSD